MNRIVERNRCNGCEACHDICSKGAIKMLRDEEGFYYPHIDEIKCVNCGLCGKVCPVRLDKSVRNIDYNDTKAYGGWIRNDDSLSKSSSGGFCAALSESVQQKEGIVYGVVFSENFREAIYTSTDDVKFQKMRGSKYVTALKDGIYSRVKDQLVTGRLVLFVGLPCEVVALYSFLGADYDNLLTCELICAGPSSYSLLDEQIKWIEQNKGGRIKSFEFRFKKYGWGPYAIYAQTPQKQYSKIFDETIFGIGMKYAKREACFNCEFKGNRRVADFTVGDFWNIDKKASYYNENGTSLVFCRTKKAEEYLHKLDNFYFEEVIAEDAINGNRQQLKYPAGVPECRESYLKTLRESGGEAAFLQYRPKRSVKKIIKNNLPVWAYKLLRRVEAKIH